MSKTIVVTHNGTFHADEALAVFLLNLTPEFKDSQLVRTRDPAVIDRADIVVDVGAVYDPSRHRYDHHQAGFTETFDDVHHIKLSSAGLIYKHFGKDIIRGILGTNESLTNILYRKMYEQFIEGMDGIDNGVERFPADVKAKYSVSSDLSARVGYLNPRWNDPQPDTEAGFKKAVQLTGSEFLERLDYYGKAWLPARSIVEKAIIERKDVHKTGEIIVLSQYCPWRDHLCSLEAQMELNFILKYVVYQDSNGSWRVQCVPSGDSSFGNRRSLPKAWRGIRDAELSQISGIEGCIFVHATGFIGGNQTYDGAMQMAIFALNAPESETK